MALRGILLDLEGVLYQDGRPIDGAIGAVAAMRESGIGIRFLTNTTTPTVARTCPHPQISPPVTQSSAEMPHRDQANDKPNE